MVIGVKRLSKTTFSRQASYSTPTSGTLTWRGPASFLEDGREVTEVEEDVGIFGSTDRSYIAKDIAKLILEETEATFEQLQYLFVGCGWGNAAGSAQGAAGSAYVFINAAPTTSAVAGTPFTFFTGNNAEAEAGTGLYTTKINLKGEGGGALKVSSEWSGKAVNRASGGTLPSGATMESVEEIVFGQGTFYLNSTGTNYGATQVSNQLLSLDLSIELMWTPKYTEGGTTPAYYVYTDHKVTGNMTFEHDSAGSIVAGATSQKHTQFKGGTAQRARLQWTGGTINSGTTFTNKTLRLDFPLKWKTFKKLDDMDGNAMMTGEFFSKYNSTGGDSGTVLIARDQALP